MNFDRVARPYRWLETIAFGNQLQRARVAFVRQIEAPRRVLIVGEGDGRFLAEFVRHFPNAEIDCIDSSATMMALARERAGSRRVNFRQADLRGVTLRAKTYDLIVTHFFLDCFGEAELQEVVEKLARAATADANWLLADFREPAGGWRRGLAHFSIRLMYAFFRLTSEIEAQELIDPSPLLRARNFVLVRQTLARGEMIKSEWWRRSA